MAFAAAFPLDHETHEIVPGRPIFTSFPDYFDIAVTHDDCSINIQFPSDLLDLSQSFAGTELDYSFSMNSVRVSGEGVKKLPHNLALSVLNTGYTEGSIALPSGQTPDFLSRDHDTLIGELKTTAGSDPRALSSVLDKAEQKYGDQCDRMFCIGVSANDVECRGIVLSEDVQEALIKARRIGDMILDQLPETFIFDRTGRDISRANEAIEDVVFNYKGVRELPKAILVTPSWMRSMRDDSTQPTRMSETDQPKMKTSLQWIKGLPGVKKDFRSAVHLPMFLTDEDEENPGRYIVGPAGDMYSLWEHVLSVRSGTKVEERTIWDLRAEQRVRDMNGWGKPSVKDMRGDPDNITCHLSEDFRLALAVRGLGAKNLCTEVKPLREHDRQRDRLGYSSDMDDSLLTSWVASDIRKMPAAMPLTPDDYFSDDVRWTEDAFKNMWESDLIQSSCNLDLVMRELSYNYRRNQVTSRSSMGLILRKVPRKPIYVLMRPTRGSGPIFYSVLYKGASLADGVFQKSHSFGGGWEYTDFVSSDPDRLSHLVNIQSQLMSLWSLLADTLTKSGLSPHSHSPLWERQVQSSLKCMSLILLEDKEDTSTCLQLLRYYYMKIYSSVPPTIFPKEEMVSKLPEVIRSPILMWLMKTWCRSDIEVDKRSTGYGYLRKPISSEDLSCCYCSSQHESIRCPVVGYDPNDTTDGGGEEEPLEATDEGDKLYDAMPPVPSPFFFVIDSSEKFLLASYVCMLHNKDEGSDHVGSLKAFSKLAKMEGVLRGKLSDTSWVPETENPTGFYEYDPSFVKLGADLIKEDLRSRSALAPGQNHRLSSLGTFAGLTLESFATTKSSTKSIFTGDARTLLPKDVEKQMAVRTKCFAALFQLLPLLVGVLLAESLGCLYSQELFTGFVIVSIFRKNQIGGVREISILDMPSRLRLAALEGITTGICVDLDEECLTKPKEKKKFVAKHSKKVSQQFDSKDCVTIKMSMDMKTWCQCFLMRMFACLLSHLLPETYFPMVANTLNSMSLKRVEMPKDVFNEFIKGPSRTMCDSVLATLRSVFWGVETAPHMSAGSTYITLHGNMLQGILHYTSSLYHVALLHVFRSIMAEHISAMGFESIISFQVSSDDEGVLMTICPGESGRPVDNQKAVRKLLRTVRRVKDMVDRKFGLATSWEKSTVVLSPIYEFNSIFHVGNTITSPLIKFVARANDDPPEDSLHKRVANMTSALSSLRDAGATGSLCSIVNYTQVLSLQRNLGKNTMSWWGAECDEMIHTGLSVTGSLKVFPPSSAGLTDVSLLNYSSLPQGPSKVSTLIRRFQLYTDLKDDDLPLVSSEFKMWNRDKHKKILEDLGIEKGELTKDDVRIIMNKPVSKEELIRRLEINLSRPSIARSFLFPKRSETVRISPYLFWSGCLRAQGEDSRLNLFELMDSTTPTENCSELFVNSGNYKEIINYMNKTMTYSRCEASKMRERHLRGYRPKENELLQAKAVISRCWFGTRMVSHTQAEHLMPKFLEMIPWLRRTYEETINQDEFQGSAEALVSAIESLTTHKTTRNLLCRPTPSNTIALETMSRRNNFRTHLAAFSRDETPLQDESALEQMRRVGRLVVLMQTSGSERFRDDLEFECGEILSVRLSPPNWQRRDLQNSMKSISRMLHSQGFVNVDHMMEHLMETKEVFWKIPQMSVNGERVGEGESFHYTLSNGWVRTTYRNEQIKRVERERGNGEGIPTISYLVSDLPSTLMDHLLGLLPTVVATPHGFRLGLWECERVSQLREVVSAKKRKRVKVGGVDYVMTKLAWGPKIPYTTMYRAGVERFWDSGPRIGLMDKWIEAQPINLTDLTLSDEPGTRDFPCRSMILESILPRMSARILKPLPTALPNDERDIDMSVLASLVEDDSDSEKGDGQETPSETETSSSDLGKFFCFDLVAGSGTDDWDEDIVREELPSRGLDAQLSSIMNLILKRIRDDNSWTQVGYESEILDLRRLMREGEEQPNRRRGTEEEKAPAPPYLRRMARYPGD